MTLLHPALFVAGLAASSIPILIHLLLRRRRPPVEWAAMELLLEAYRRQRRRMRLEQFLLLACRCLIFGLAGLALARPVLESTGLFAAGGRRAVAVLLDDGATTRVLDPNLPGGERIVFDRLKRAAAALVRALSPGDEVSVILAARPAAALVAPPSTDRESVARAIEQLAPRWSRAELPEAIGIARSVVAAADASERIVAVLSEFRNGSFDPSVPPPTAAGGPRFLVSEPAEEEIQTVAVSSLEVQRSVDDDGVDVVVRLERSGGDNAAGTVRLRIEGAGYAPAPPRTVRFEAGQETALVEQSLRALVEGDPDTRTSGAIVATVESESFADGMPADDSRHAWFDPRSSMRIAVATRRAMVGGEFEQMPAALWLMRALAPIERSGVEVFALEPASIDARSLRNVDALFLPRPDAVDGAAWTALREFVDAGGLLVVMPAPEAESRGWIERFVASLGLPWVIDPGAEPLETPLRFAAVQPARAMGDLFAAIAAELPDLLRPVETIRRHAIVGAGADAVLFFADGTPFLVASEPDVGRRGVVLFFAAAPELGSTNLPVKPLMVPLMQEIVRRGLAGIGRRDRAETGEALRALPSGALAREIESPTGRRIPLREGQAPTLDEPGVWTLRDEGGAAIAGVAVNIEREALRLDRQSKDSVAEWFGAVGSARVAPANALAERLQPPRDATGAAVWILAAVLGVAFLETAIARRASHASRDAAGADPGVRPQTSFGWVGGRAAA